MQGPLNVKFIHAHHVPTSEVNAWFQLFAGSDLFCYYHSKFRALDHVAGKYG
jgi:hypothetical protein